MIAFDKFYQHYPRKQSRGAAEKVWARLKPDEPLLMKMLAAIDEQKKWRDKAVRENAGRMQSKQIHIPDWPHPSTWLNQTRWEDQMPAIHVSAAPNNKTLVLQCSECERPSVIAVREVPYCAYHYTQAETNAFRDLYENLKAMGLAKRKDETKAEWGLRCRDYARQTYPSIASQVEERIARTPRPRTDVQVDEAGRQDQRESQMEYQDSDQEKLLRDCERPVSESPEPERDTSTGPVF